MRDCILKRTVSIVIVLGILIIGFTMVSFADQTEPEQKDTSGTEIQIDENNFPDDNFRAIISNYKDKDENGFLSEDEIAAVTDLYIVDKGVSALDGIEIFYNLTSLNCGYNQLTSLDVNDCTALTVIDCEGNQLTSLDVSGLQALNKLNCDNNQLTSLGVNNCSSLTILSCSNNQLTSIDITGISALEVLSCNENMLTELDVSDCSALKSLSCWNNQLTSLNVSGFSVLETLVCRNNQLTSLNITGCSALHDLSCQNNQLTSLNVSGFSVLETLLCYENQLQQLDVSNCTALVELDCSDNQLSYLDVNGFSALKILVCYENQLTELDVSDCSTLWNLWCYGNQLSSLDVSTCYALRDLYCDNNQLTSLDISNCPKLIDYFNSGDHFSNDGIEMYGKDKRIYSMGMWIDSSVIVITTNAISGFTVSYNANGGTGAPSSQPKEENVPLTLSSVQPTKNYVISYNANGGSLSSTSKSVSCSFNNWNTAQDGSGTTYNSGGSYTADADVTFYAQWTDPQAGALEKPVRSNYDFSGWFTSATGGERITESSFVTGNMTIYAHWTEQSDPYNLGDETYSFENYSDYDSPYGHCFGMSITSSGYHNNLIDISRIGGNANTPLYSFNASQTVKKPICYYQDIQGSFSVMSTVAGGSYYLGRGFDVASDWQEVVNYVQNNEYDGTGLLQIGYRKKNEGGHAINFLRYENVNGQDRIYAYDNNFPNQETYFYKDAYDKVHQAPVQTFSGTIDCIALRDSRIYFDIAGDYDATHALYMEEAAASIKGYSYTYMEDVLPKTEYVMYEIPADQNSVIVIPKEDYASFIYMDKEYSFGKITDETYGTLKLSANNEEASGQNESFIITNETTEAAPAPTSTAEQMKSPAEKITISKKPVIRRPIATKNKITVKWKHFKHTSKKAKKIWKKIKKVQIQCAKDKNFKSIVKRTTVSKKKTKGTIKRLKKNTTYYVRVRYFDGSGYSKWSKVRKIKTKRK